MFARSAVQQKKGGEGSGAVEALCTNAAGKEKARLMDLQWPVTSMVHQTPCPARQQLVSFVLQRTSY